jgi:hypothetical protein
MTIKALIQRHPVASYFGIAYKIPTIAFLVIVGPRLLRGQSEQATDALAMFPVMEVGVCLRVRHSPSYCRECELIAHLFPADDPLQYALGVTA